MTNKADWIAVDWGTSSLRVWALEANGDILSYRTADKGMGQLSRSDFEPALLDIIEDLLDTTKRTTVIICGMAGARQGWAEAPYVTTPCPPPGIDNATKIEGSDPRLDVRILPGVKQMTPPDVMRGEETQIAGFLGTEPGWSGLLCLPGTHTKWAMLEKGRIEGFRTFMTGELFALIGTHSVLRHSLDTKDLDQDAFAKAVLEIAARPEDLTARLFELRAASLIADQSAAQARGRLSGYLIGAEVLAAIAKGFTGEVTILGGEGISRAYKTALEVLGHTARLTDAGTLTLNGLKMAHKQIANNP